MIYSVWNQPSRSYDYYEAPDKQLGANTPSPKHIDTLKLGVPVDRAGWPLPGNAVKVGSGDRAKGRIASRPGASRAGLGAIPMDPNTLGIIGMGVAAFLLWKMGFAKAPR